MKVFRNFATFLVAAGFAASVFGQAQSGNIYGSVSDEQGGKLPGVAVGLTGCGAPKSTTTDSQGNFHFLSLAPCTYAVRTELSGFATVERTNVVVSLGTNTELPISMKIAAQAVTVTVSSETPLLDTHKQTSGSNISQQELKSIPTARDPWVILQQSPGVLMDRQNVGGSLSGQQDNYVGHGTEPSQNAMSLDGVTITDMAALGSTPTYFDFDAMQEMQITTGGTDPSVTAPGVSLNMVTKRGTNEVHGSARLFDTPSELEAFNIPQEAKDQGLKKTNRVNHIDDYGIEAGGPVWTDKAWLWGSYSKNPIQLLTAGGSPNNYTLENWAGKLNVQPIESNSFTFFYWRNDKQNIGRNSGTTRPAGSGTPWDQTGPASIWKGEDSQVFGPNLVASASWSYVRGGFQLLPQGGLGKDAFQDADGVWHNSYLAEIIYRPQHQATASASYFFNTGNLGNELKFGFSYRHIFVKTTIEWPGSHNFGIQNFDGAGDDLAVLSRPGAPRNTQKYYGGYLQDTITVQNLTINAGLRYDYQTGNNNASSAPDGSLIDPNTGLPFLQALNYPGASAEIKWKNWEPRVGLTYALGAEKKTLLRASYARYADQLGASSVVWDNPVKSAYLYYYWNDNNHNGIINNGELGAQAAPPVNYDPNNPNATFSTNQIARNLKATTTDEFMLGVDHQLMPELVAGLSYTHRKRKNFIWTPYIGISSSDFVLDPALSNQPVVGFNGQVIGNTGNVYGLDPSTDLSNFNGGTILSNRPNYSTTYDGVEFQFTKRLKDRWMAHGSFTWTNWKQSEGANSCQDKTQVVIAAGGGGPFCGTDVYWYGSGTNSGSYPYVFINSKWNFNINGLYQLPLNFNFAANLYGRQGYYAPTVVALKADDVFGSKNVLVSPNSVARNKNLYQLDLRVEKVMPLFQKADLTLSIDMFNTFNSNTTLQVRDEGRLASAPANSSSGRIFEIQSPRILRFGARLSF